MRKMLLAAVATAPLLTLGACAGDSGYYDDTAAVDSAIGTQSQAAMVEDDAWDWDVFDTDNDRALTRDEYDVIGTDFDRVDVDRSGYIEEDEYAAWSGGVWGDDRRDQTAALFDDWDDDRDSALTEDEWADDEEFFLWDDDRSGFLEEDEGLF